MLFTRDVWCRRGGEGEGYRMLNCGEGGNGEYYCSSFVAAAAPNLRFGVVDKWDPPLLRQAIENMFYIPKMNVTGATIPSSGGPPDIKVLILGAWGCGAFGCPTEEMARLFAAVMKETKCCQLYDEIHFAVPQMDGSDNDRVYLRALQEAFGEKNVQVVDVTRVKAGEAQAVGVAAGGVAVGTAQTAQLAVLQPGGASSSSSSPPHANPDPSTNSNTNPTHRPRRPGR